MELNNNFVLFSIEGQSFVIRLNAVKRIARAVSVTRIHNAPDVIEGVVNIQGEIIPVVNLRKRFNLPLREIGIDDHFIVANTKYRSVAVLVDEVKDIIESLDDAIVSQQDILPGHESIEGIVKTANNMILIQDLDKLLSLEEEELLDKSLASPAMAASA